MNTLLFFFFAFCTTASFACEFNLTHCNCLFSTDPTTSKCYRPLTETTCMVDSCIAAYKCSCAGTEMCEVGSCGAWRPDVSGPDPIAAIVDCHYADSTSAESASCISTPLSAIAPTPSVTGTAAASFSASPSSSVSAASSSSPTPAASVSSSISAAPSSSPTPAASPSSSVSAAPSSSPTPSSSPPPSQTPSASPISAQCPGGQNTFSMIDEIEASATYASPKTITYGNGQSITIWGEGMNLCNTYFDPAAPDGSAPGAWKMRAEFFGTNGECASVPVTTRNLQNYVVHGIESDGTYYFQPTVEVFEVDFTAVNDPTLWESYPREVLGFVGFRDGTVVYPTVTIANPSITILEERQYTLSAADLALLGETSGAISIPMVTVGDGSALHCTASNWNTCTATFTFSEPISKLLTFGTATYTAPSLTVNKIDAGVNPFQFTC